MDQSGNMGNVPGRSAAGRSGSAGPRDELRGSVQRRLHHLNLPFVLCPVVPEDVPGAVGAVELDVLVVLPAPPVQDPDHLDPALPEQERPRRLLRPVSLVAEHADFHPPLPPPFRNRRGGSIIVLFPDDLSGGEPDCRSRSARPCSGEASSPSSSACWPSTSRRTGGIRGRCRCGMRQPGPPGGSASRSSSARASSGGSGTGPPSST